MANVTVDPLVPLGSESLRTGASRIKAIAAALLQILGFDGTTQETFPAPFPSLDASGLLTVVGDPVEPLGIATARYAGRKVLFASITSGDAALYTGVTDPTFDSYDINWLYLLYNIGPVNNGAVTVQLNAAPAVALLRADASGYGASTLFNGTMVLVAYDGANLRALDFIGGTLSQVLTLAADPTAALQATTRQYVDNGIVVPVQTTMGADVALGSVAAAAMSYALTTPDDGHQYVIHAAYSLNCAIFNAQNDANGSLPCAAYLSDGSFRWGSAGHTVIGPAAASEAHPILAAGGYSPTLYPPNTPVTITVEVVGNASSAAFATVSNTAQNVPESSLIVTLIRAQVP